VSLAMCDGDHGLVVHCHAGCDACDILAELRRRGLIGGTGDAVRPVRMTVRCGDRADIARRIALARRVWDGARDPRGTPVMAYLAGRGITIPLPPSLRWAPALRRPDGTYAPAMVARVDGLDGELIGVHRTWLYSGDRGRWHRRDRASLGPIASGAVRLAPAAAMLLVGEGIETSLAAMEATRIPAWSALSTAGLTRLVLPPSVRTVVSLADHDHNGAGERAARGAAVRWLAEGRSVRIAMPPEPGTDFNDMLVGGAYALISKVGDVAA
jgi:putative DNA primase/helicase